ncbi:MAG TPA: twin-arginine translocase TatA/TatE family subunit [Thermomicrobiaceae bacterium]|nr:twin-arginine translocase TatA/TatE family subunit [Thermomicrobiaceae bacterium]
MDIGPMELVIVLAVVLIVFGPGKLPDLGRTLGGSIREFRDSVRGDDEEPQAEEHKPEPPAAV